VVAPSCLSGAIDDGCPFRISDGVMGSHSRPEVGLGIRRHGVLRQAGGVPSHGRLGEPVRRRADGVEDVTVSRAHAIDHAPVGAAPDDLWTLHHHVDDAGEAHQCADWRASVRQSRQGGQRC
jgi:hypothetical protein